MNGSDPQPESPARSAKYNAGAGDVSVAKPYDGIFDDNGVINNNVQLQGKDGSEVTLIFEGSSAATYQLKKYSDAVYKSPSGTQYNAVSGTLVISSYKVDGVTHMFSGTFSFVATSITNSQSSITITGGVITNCSNDF